MLGAALRFLLALPFAAIASPSTSWRIVLAFTRPSVSAGWRITLKQFTQKLLEFPVSLVLHHELLNLGPYPRIGYFVALFRGLYDLIFAGALGRQGVFNCFYRTL